MAAPIVHASLATRAEPKGGLYTYSEACAAGWSESGLLYQERSGRISRIFPGVYLPSGIPITSELLNYAAALAQPNAVLTGHSALAAVGLVENWPNIPRLLIPHGVRRSKLPGVSVVKSRDIDPLIDILPHGRVAVPCAHVTRAIIDDAAHATPAHLSMLVDRVIMRGVNPTDWLARATQLMHPRRPGSYLVADLLLSLPKDPDRHRSSMEMLVTRRLEGAGLPVGRVNVKIQTDVGEFEVDRYWDPPGSVLESDGKHHEGPGQQAFDDSRTAALRRAGIAVARVRYDDIVRRPSVLIRRVRALLDRS